MSEPDHNADRNSLPLDLTSILLVEADPELRSSRRMLLASLEHPVLAVASYHELSTLPADSNCCLVAIDLCPYEHEARKIATYVRSTWPTAKILLFGEPSPRFDDWLYDDSVRACWSPLSAVRSARILIEANIRLR
jgi:hypothetical protein